MITDRQRELAYGAIDDALRKLVVDDNGSWQDRARRLKVSVDNGLLDELLSWFDGSIDTDLT